MTTRTLLLPGRRSDSFYAWAETLRVVKWNPSRAARDISLFFRSNFPVRLFQIPCSVILNSLLFRNRELPANYLKYRGLPRQETAGSAQKWPEFPVFPCYSWFTSRDRIAPTCTIRHPVWPIVALQRRVRFSAPLARYCRIRCHQRRARRAELASFSVFVSNLDFRVPRSRQRGERAAARAVQYRKRGRPMGPESRPGLPWRSRLARSGPGAPRPP